MRDHEEKHSTIRLYPALGVGGVIIDILHMIYLRREYAERYHVSTSLDDCDLARNWRAHGTC